MNPVSAPLSVPGAEHSLYRGHCIALLRRYFCMSVEVGRLPALLGREFFRSRVRSSHVHTFEDKVIFVIDVERCLDRLDPFDKQLIACIVLQEYTQEEAAKLLGCTDRQIRNRFPDAVDTVTALLLEKRLLKTRKHRKRAPDPIDPPPTVISIGCCADRDLPVVSSLITLSQLVPAFAERA